MSSRWAIGSGAGGAAGLYASGAYPVEAVGAEGFSGPFLSTLAAVEEPGEGEAANAWAGVGA